MKDSVHQKALSAEQSLPPRTELSAQCTLCAAVESPGFYTGCMFKDGYDCNGWTCDGNGNLSRPTGAA
jgi:hypothetical protein